MSSKSFQGFGELRELQCSGETLPQDSDLMAMVLFEATSNNILAVANLRKMECSTSNTYVACHLDDTDIRKSRLKVLIDDLAEGQSRVYGCNVSAFASGIRMESFSWSVTVHHISKLTFMRTFIVAVFFRQMCHPFVFMTFIDTGSYKALLLCVCVTFFPSAIMSYAAVASCPQAGN